MGGGTVSIRRRAGGAGEVVIGAISYIEQTVLGKQLGRVMAYVLDVRNELGKATTEGPRSHVMPLELGTALACRHDLSTTETVSAGVAVAAAQAATARVETTSTGVAVSRLDLALDNGSPAVGYTAAGDWTNPERIIGPPDGSSAQESGAVLDTREGTIDVTFQTLARHTALTLGTVELTFHVGTSGAVLANGNLRVAWRVASVHGAAWQTLQTVTGNSSAPLVHDLTAELTWTWALVGEVEAQVYGQTDLAESGITYTADAIVRRVTGTRTDNL